MSSSEPLLAFASRALYTRANAQVPRHPPNVYRDTHTDRRDALASRPATPGPWIKRQASPSYCLRSACLSSGPHGPNWAPARFH